MTKRERPTLKELERQFDLRRRELAGTGYISHGSVQDRTAREGGGAGYQWTRKVAAKTVTVALTQEQFVAMKAAVLARRKLAKLVREMEVLSRQILFQTYPHPNRRKSLSRKALGLK